MVRIRQPTVALGQVYSRSFASHNRAQLRSCVDALAASTRRVVPPLLASATRLHPPSLQSRNLALLAAPLGTPAGLLRPCAFAHHELLKPSVLQLDAHTSTSPTLSLLAAATAFRSLHPSHYAVTDRNILDIEMADPPIYICSSDDDDVEMVDVFPSSLTELEHDMDVDMDVLVLDPSPEVNMDDEHSNVLAAVSDATKIALPGILVNVPAVNHPEVDVEMQDERQASIDYQMALLDALANVPVVIQLEVDVEMQDAQEALPESNIEADSSFTIEDLAPRSPSSSSVEVTNMPSLESSLYDSEWAGVIESLQEQLASLDALVLAETDFEVAPTLDTRPSSCRLTSTPLGSPSAVEADSPWSQLSMADASVQSSTSDESFEEQSASFDTAETDMELAPAFDTRPLVYRLNSPPRPLRRMPLVLLLPSEAGSPCPRLSAVDVSVKSSASDESLEEQTASFDLNDVAETDKEVMPALDTRLPVYRLSSPPPRPLRRMPFVFRFPLEADSPCLRLSMVDMSRLSPFQVSCQPTDSVDVNLGSPSAGVRTVLGNVSNRRETGLSNVEEWEEGEGLGRVCAPGERSRGREHPTDLHVPTPTPPPLLSHFSFSLQPLSLPPLPPF